MRGIREAVRIREMRIVHAERPRLVVHLVDERRHGAGGRLGERDRGAVVRDEHHAADELLRAEHIARRELQRAVFRLVRSRRHEDVLMPAQEVERQEARHHLRHARGRALRVRVLLIDDAPRRRLDDDGGRRDRRRVRRPRAARGQHPYAQPGRSQTHSHPQEPFLSQDRQRPSCMSTFHFFQRSSLYKKRRTLFKCDAFVI